jgi:hypothetical protein
MPVEARIVDKRAGRTKQGTSFRLSPKTVRLIEALSEQLGVNKTAVVEQAVRLMARREKATLDDRAEAIREAGN